MDSSIISFYQQAPRLRSKTTDIHPLQINQRNTQAPHAVNETQKKILTMYWALLKQTGTLDVRETLVATTRERINSATFKIEHNDIADALLLI